ncbi:glucose-6-phosphate dehydrogenase assembly protein OpcA [Singulisphaera sp. PoT]|uniref:glucose-6-phosphate dehydrogenase assembly protein OpcA n=1 Tax=Singulisphaera sp. PoT TaxID=3411797 RepID=UPI003BF5BC9A
MSNLIIYCVNQTQAELIVQELDEIVRLHPSRVLLLVGDPKASPSSIEAFVSALCHLSGSSGQVCSEHITIQASGDAVLRLPTTTRALLIGDLPTTLWWASHESPSLGGVLFTELEDMADQVIYSCLGWDEPRRDTIATAKWVVEAESTETLASDITWRRLKPWRSLIGQSLDPAAVPGALGSITEVVVECGSHGLPESWLLVGWLASRLGWRPTGFAQRKSGELGWTLQASGRNVDLKIRRIQEGSPEIRSIATAWTVDRSTATMTVASQGPGKLGMSYQGVDAQPRLLIAPNQSRATLVGLQLQDLERDIYFDAALQVARQLAESSTLL